ncbi:MAG TPA: ATP-binding cassette domain-containing protein [Steroidobacteraceae bacterium]|nr:ATP-binding cassette domain-containing protein [Steroidobacteraceae bacterium]
MLRFDEVSLRRGKRLVLSAATFTIFRGEKVGITGANGAGKSSLLALVRGELQVEAGTLELPPGLAIAHVAQELEARDELAIEHVLDGDAELRRIEREIAGLEHGSRYVDAERRQVGDKSGVRLAELHARYEAVGGYSARTRAARLMHGLGFEAADETRPVRAFSGGWRVRLNLAQALMCRSDLLLLDEPTNHLDLDAILWLEEWLREYRGTLLLIAHDREFLDAIADRIVHLEQGRARAYRGNYSAFEEQRAAALAGEAALFARQQREIAHMQSFIDRFRAKASKARQAQSRLKALARLERIAPAHVDSPLEIAFERPAKLPRPLLALERQSAGYDGREVLRGLTLTLVPGDRIALLGRNGAGKSTCMKLLAGELPALAGTRTEARDLEVGYFAQHQIEQLLPEESPLGALRRVGGSRAERATEQELRDYLATFGFRAERVFEPVAPFSGGEKSRLVLALIAYRRPNLLLLDEPTNHLDLDMRRALAVALQDYEGAVVLVSHDRHLLKTVADELYVVAGGGVAPFGGDLDEYARSLVEARGASGESEPPARDTEASSAVARRERKRLEAEQRNRLSPLRAAVAGAERELERLHRETAALQGELASPELYAPEAKERLQAILARQARLVRELAAAEDAWLECSERLEAEMLR